MLKLPETSLNTGSIVGCFVFPTHKFGFGRVPQDKASGNLGTNIQKAINIDGRLVSAGWLCHPQQATCLVKKPLKPAGKIHEDPSKTFQYRSTKHENKNETLKTGGLFPQQCVAHLGSLAKSTLATGETTP